MLRRDALKVLGLHAVAIVGLSQDGFGLSQDGLARVSPSKYPYQVELGWYGVIRCDKPFTLQRVNESVDTGFQFRVYAGIVGDHQPIFTKFISDKFLVSLQKAGCLSFDFQKEGGCNLNYKYDLMSQPKMTQIVYFNKGCNATGRLKLPQPILIQAWDEEITVRFPNHEPNYLMVGKKGKYYTHFGWVNTSGQGFLEETLDFCLNGEFMGCVDFDSHGIKMMKYNKNPIKRTRRYYREGKLAFSLYVIPVDDWWVAKGEWIAAHNFCNGAYNLTMAVTDALPRHF